MRWGLGEAKVVPRATSRLWGREGGRGGRTSPSTSHSRQGILHPPHPPSSPFPFSSPGPWGEEWAARSGNQPSGGSGSGQLWWGAPWGATPGFPNCLLSAQSLNSRGFSPTPTSHRILVSYLKNGIKVLTSWLSGGSVRVRQLWGRCGPETELPPCLFSAPASPPGPCSPLFHSAKPVLPLDPPQSPPGLRACDSALPWGRKKDSPSDLPRWCCWWGAGAGVGKTWELSENKYF